MMSLLLLFGLMATLSESKTSDVQFFCPNHNPQKTIDVQLLMGQWYIVEIVHHLSQDGLQQMHELYMDSCPTVFLVQDDHSNIRIIWSEDSLTAYYHVKKTDPSAPGFWIASGPHQESIADHPGQHMQYTGTIEVMKAVGNHAVLTFCKSDHANSQLFSVVLSREPRLARADTHGVNQMLHLRGLRPMLIKRTCNGAKANLLAGSLLILLTTCLLL